jgi:hypothetical protein
VNQDPAKDGANWFGYCYSNPLRRIDILGLESDDSINDDDDEFASHSVNNGGRSHPNRNDTNSPNNGHKNQNPEAPKGQRNPDDKGPQKDDIAKIGKMLGKLAISKAKENYEEFASSPFRTPGLNSPYNAPYNEVSAIGRSTIYNSTPFIGHFKSPEEVLFEIKAGIFQLAWQWKEFARWTVTGAVATGIGGIVAGNVTLTGVGTVPGWVAGIILGGLGGAAAYTVGGWW